MKKLYFLNEEEKNRILNIHQNATKRQYLLKEDANDDTLKKWGGYHKTRDKEGRYIETTEELVDKKRKEFNDEIRKKCLNNSYGGPTFSSGELSSEIDYFYRSFSARERTLYYWESALGKIKDYIRSIENMGNFCAINKGFSERGGYKSVLPGTDLLYGMNMFIVNDSSWENNIQLPLKELMSGTGYRKVKSIQTDPVKKQEGGLLEPILKKHNEMLSSQRMGNKEWISLSPKYDKEILQALGKTGDKLTDDDIKDIYNKLKSAGKIK